jgi:NAD+ synthase
MEPGHEPQGSGSPPCDPAIRRRHPIPPSDPRIPAGVFRPRERRLLNPTIEFSSFPAMELDEGTKPDLSLDPETVRRMLVGFLRDETTNAGFRKAVLGLSGGVDSAVCAALAAEALGTENVLGVLMPYRTSAPESRRDAETVADRLRIRTELVEITPMVDALLTVRKIDDPLRRGNVMARARMIVLYDISSRDRALVYGTSNKTELLLGYGTMFGDMASALNPLGDLYKTQVWALAQALGVPAEVIRKRPSADLWEGQTDEGEMGFLYRDADQVLALMVDQRRTVDDVIAMGWDPRLVRRIREMMERSQFKRRLPLIAKVSGRTVNVDFRYPRDWGI